MITYGRFWVFTEVKINGVQHYLWRAVDQLESRAATVLPNRS